jgi:hypothetical protein
MKHPRVLLAEEHPMLVDTLKGPLEPRYDVAPLSLGFNRTGLHVAIGLIPPERGPHCF